MMASPAAPLPEVAGLDRDELAERRRATQPFVIRGLASTWPAVTAAQRSDADFIAYLKRFSTPRPVVALVGQPEIDGRFFYTEALTALNFERGTSPLDPFLDRLLRDREAPRPLAMAVQGEDVAGLLPGFERENGLEALLPGVPPRAWLGNRIRVATHYDLKENIGIVVAGRRRFTLFPPDQIGNLYPGPLELTPAGTPVSMVDPAAPDLELHPRFAEAWRHAATAELGPGDAIYIPYHWWHAVDSLAPVNLFVNYWWGDAVGLAASPGDVLMLAIGSLRQLPPDQREAWRAVFAHFVFDADPAEHLPAAVRGIYGPPTPAMIRHIRSLVFGD
ncbi:cupin-like domain-containing protein [Sphingomonas ginkgonis]|uniref:Cupin-like domain-containing protein n=1 Tax=Sphingomonas ginkgonis TaxID=2315330 RepID=A0A429V8J1_9SPHN|nr:cupin-like domain-containing protein [Sphingomonas ginkgonis]RST30202.1 cupin-like domain-containing protein [Sphingomonas ginkgonis]